MTQRCSDGILRQGSPFQTHWTPKPCLRKSNRQLANPPLKLPTDPGEEPYKMVLRLNKTPKVQCCKEWLKNNFCINLRRRRKDRVASPTKMSKLFLSHP